MTQLTLDDVLIRRIDAAITRLEAIQPQTETLARSIGNLKEKRVLVASGNFVLRRIDGQIAETFGRLVCLSVKYLWRPPKVKTATPPTQPAQAQAEAANEPAPSTSQG